MVEVKKRLWNGQYILVVKEEDYLKVVEEGERLKLNIERWEEISIKTKQNFTSEINKKNEEINSLKERLKGKTEQYEKEKDEHNKTVGELNKYYIKSESLKKELKNKDEEIDNLIDKVNELDKENQGLSIRCESLEEEVEELRDKVLHGKEIIEGKQRTIDYLNKFIEINEKEETYTLSYSYLGTDGVTIKNYRQSGLLKEEYEEMYGMDSDNWLSHSLVKDRKEVL